MLNIKVKGNVVQGEIEGRLKELNTDTMMVLHTIQQMIKDTQRRRADDREGVRI